MKKPRNIYKYDYVNFKMKKEIVLLVFGFLLIGLFISVVYANTVSEDISNLMDGAKEVGITVFSKVLGDPGSNGGMDVFFAKILLVVVLFSIVYSIISKMPGFSSSDMATFFVSVAVSILGVRFLTAEFVEAILIPYGAMGASILVFLPMLIYGFFVYTNVKGSFGRRIAWIIFALFFFGFWLTNYDKIGGVGGLANWVYTLGLLIILGLIIFDNFIKMAIHGTQYGKAMSAWNERLRVANLRKLKQLDKDLAAGIIDKKYYYSERKRLRDLIKENTKNM